MNICKRQTFIGKKYQTFKKKYLRILFYIASCIYEAAAPQKVDTERWKTDGK